MIIRDDAIDALIQFEKSTTSMKTLLRELQTVSVDTSDTLIPAQSLSLGVIRFRNTLDYILNRSLGKKKLQNLNDRDRNILRLMLYEIKWLDTVTDDALSFFPEIGAKYRDVILKAVETDLDAIMKRLAPVNKLSLKYSHPTFLIKTLLDNLPLEDTIQLMNTNNKKRTSYLRINRLLDCDNSILESIDGIKLEKDPDVSGLYRIMDGTEKIIRSKHFQDGAILIQDKASILTVEALNPQPGQTIWDSCAAPGMKTQLIAEKLMGTGKLIASDVYRDRVKLARDRSIILNASQIEWLHADSTKPTVTSADKILIDAPCTSTGILQAYPSFKWRLNKQVLFSLMTIQNKLLDGILSSYQDKPETEIVFSTCSILPHEGESQIDSALSRFDVDLLEPLSLGTRGYPGFKCSDRVTRLFPHKHKTSGFFIARMRIR
ncbi:MAG: transcription antitermination factor NusB [Candidatus Thorarchaeota archaeon]